MSVYGGIDYIRLKDAVAKALSGSIEPVLVELQDYVTSPSPFETDVIGLPSYTGPKTIVFYNSEDVDVYVDVYANIIPTGRFYPIRTSIVVPAQSVRACLLTEAHPYIKFVISSPSIPRSGNFKVRVLCIPS